MALPSRLVYNDLDGEEVKHVLEERFRRLLSEVSFLRRHVTLPRVKMTTAVLLDVYADQPTPERHTITDEVELGKEGDLPSTAPVQLELTDIVNAAPGGQPPDQIREEHRIPVPTPVRGPIAVEDQLDLPGVEGRRVTMANGAIVDRTGQAPERRRSTVVVQDWGQAGLAHGQMNRPPMPLRGTRDGDPIAPPKFPPRE